MPQESDPLELLITQIIAVKSPRVVMERLAKVDRWLTSVHWGQLSTAASPDGRRVRQLIGWRCCSVLTERPLLRSNGILQLQSTIGKPGEVKLDGERAIINLIGKAKIDA